MWPYLKQTLSSFPIHNAITLARKWGKEATDLTCQLNKVELKILETIIIGAAKKPIKTTTKILRRPPSNKPKKRLNRKTQVDTCKNQVKKIKVQEVDSRSEYIKIVTAK